MIIEKHLDQASDAKSLSAGEKFDDSTDGSMDLRRILAYAGALYWLVTTFIIVPIGCIISLYTIIYPPIMLSWILRIRLDFVNRIEHFLCHMVNDHWVAASQYMGLQISEYGDDLNQIADKRVLFLCNHLSLVDHFCLMTAFNNKKSLPGRYLWVIFNIWKWTPLGAMWTSHGNFFINGGQVRRTAVLEKFRGHLKRLYWKFNYGFIVMYPEGSRFYLVKDKEQRFAEKDNLKPFKNCVHPRTGAVYNALQVCGKSIADESKANAGDFPPLEYLVDCSLGYPKGDAVSLDKAILGEWPHGNSNVAVHYKIHKIRSEWQNEEVLKKWLYEQYEEKDKLLEKFYETNTFGGKRRPVNFPISRALTVQFFWITTFLIHYNIWLKPLLIFTWSSFAF